MPDQKSAPFLSGLKANGASDRFLLCEGMVMGVAGVLARERREPEELEEEV